MNRTYEIMFITVRMDEEEKRLAKVKALRDSKVKRSAQPIAQTPQAPAAAPDAETAAPAEAEEEIKAVASEAHVASDAPPETAAAAV
jgi:small subunit ribosomal protein S6